ncbi:unnamed protein product [Lymnaea stagnalis]|uniref:Major facilitator superfamily (MFS) profile domain-containing protein n=1 Tax=Lymnaea stagnalis TaxID=6523 RepID=A0AAV2INZ3_LYMST
MEGGTWGIVIVISAFMIQVLTFGTTASIGVYNIEFLDYFTGSSVGVSLIGSVNFGVYLGSGPIVSFLMTKFCYRKIAFCGSALVLVGLLGMPFLPYIPTMCLFFGVLTGFGNCCTYIPSHVLSGLYYDKYRSIATGVSTSGSGLGGAVLPVLVGFLIDVYSWKGSIIFLAGLNLHLFIFAALLRYPPLPSVAGEQKTPKPKLVAEEYVADRQQDASGTSIIPRSSRHVYIFTNYRFNIYFFSNIMWNAGYAIIQSFAPEFLQDKGLTMMEAAWLSGAFGLASFVGGVVGGVSGNIETINRQMLYTAACLVMGAATIGFPQFQHTALYTLLLVISGLAFGVILGLLIVVLTDLVGVESLGNGLGYLMLSNGLGTFLGPPLASK